MSTTRRDFICRMGTGLAAAGAAASALACDSTEDGAQSLAPGDSERLLVRDPDHVEPAPLGYDRLPLEWHQARATALKERLAERGVDAVLLSNDQNMVYFTGCFRGSGERSTWSVLLTGEEDTVYWYSPGIDRDLIESWWSTENEYYFGYPHAEGGFPNRGQVVQGATVNLFEWMLEGLRRRGLGGGTIAVTMMSFRISDLKGLVSVIMRTYMFKLPEPGQEIERIINYSNLARKEGLLALEAKLKEVDDSFFAKGVQLVIDGFAADTVRDIMDLELTWQHQRHSMGKKMLANLSDPSSIGAGMAVALLTTFYGAVLANAVFIPLSGKLEVRAKEELLLRELMIEGIVAIQSGEKPQLIKEKLKGFLPPSVREAVAV